VNISIKNNKTKLWIIF